MVVGSRADSQTNPGIVRGRGEKAHARGNGALPLSTAPMPIARCPLPNPTGPYAGDGGVTLAHVFSSSKLDFASFAGWMAVVANAAAALGAGVAVAALVERAKKCLDFTTTLYGIHFVLCWAVGGFPRSAAWWIVNAAGCAGAAAGSEYVCLQRELADIPLGAALRRAAAAAAAGVAGAAAGGKEAGGGVELTGPRGAAAGGTGSARAQSGSLPL